MIFIYRSDPVEGEASSVQEEEVDDHFDLAIKTNSFSRSTMKTRRCFLTPICPARPFEEIRMHDTADDKTTSEQMQTIIKSPASSK
jgi:spore coat protein CotF